MNIEIELDDILEDFENMVDDVDSIVTTKIGMTAYKIERTAKQNCRVDTGRLRGSITTNVKQLEAEVGSNVEYAGAVEFGTGPYIIKPKEKKALYWKGAEHPVKAVHHPGIKAHPYLIPAFEEHTEDLPEKIAQGILKGKKK